MRSSTRTLIVLATLAAALAAPAFAWKGESATGVRPIAEVNAKAESGDFVMVEGTITQVSTASGSRHVVTLEDATGSLLVRVPEHLLRNLNDGRAPEVGRVVRVGGKWTHAYLDQDTWGIEAESAERVK
jgi:RecJ-like exonuclease